MERKRAQARHVTREVMSKALDNFSIGDFKLQPLQTENSRMDAQEMLLSDIREKLLGKTVKATGSIVHAEKQLYFIPRQVDGVF
jgi:hypothetical protein